MNLIDKFLGFLNPRQRRALMLLVGLMLMGMVFETLSVGLALPTLTLLTQRETSLAAPAVQQSFPGLATLTNEQLIIGAMLFLVVVFLIKGIFLAFLAWRQAKFVFDLQADVSQRLFNNYLRQPYTFHLQHNTAQLIRNVVTETSIFANTGLLAAMILSTELLVLFGLCALLLYVEPLGAVLVAVALTATGWAFYALTHGHVLRWGEARQYHEGLRIQHLQQGLGGVKDVKLLGRETQFLDNYQQHNLGTAHALRMETVLLQLPRLGLELLAISGLAILVLVVIVQGKPLDALLPTLGLFAAAAFRLMPSANRVLTAIQHIRYSMPVVDVLHSELQRECSPTPASGEKLTFGAALTLDGVSFTYPDAETPTLDHISISIQHGTSVGFIGGSGAGKSTLVDLILGLLEPDHGGVVVDGVDIRSNLRGWQDKIGYVPQSIYLTDDTLRRNIAFGLADDEIDEEQVWRAVALAQLDGFVRQLPTGLDTTIGERGVRLSGGQRQRIGIARALYHDPEVLVLDEATSSLDVVTEASVMKAVEALHGAKTILIIAHRHSTVEHCDKLYRLENGTIIGAGHPKTILNPQRLTS